MSEERHLFVIGTGGAVIAEARSCAVPGWRVHRRRAAAWVPLGAAATSSTKLPINWIATVTARRLRGRSSAAAVPQPCRSRAAAAAATDHGAHGAHNFICHPRRQDGKAA